MARGRDTHNVRPDKQLRQDILANVSDPDTLRVIFDLASDVAFGRITLQSYVDFCQELPCIFWRPSDDGQRHVTVAVTREIERKLIHVARAVWVLTRQVVSAQGPSLRGDEEVLHSCGNNGQHNTGRDACLNPAHFIRGTVGARIKLKVARAAMRDIIGVVAR